MTTAYDEWAAARTPSLLAFAVAVLDEEDAAEAAVARALARLRSTWSRTWRDDPDLEARRLVVRTSGRLRRSAVALRVLEERSDAEIAEVLRCSPAAARRQLQRGLAELGEEHRTPDAVSAYRDRVVARAGTATAQRVAPAPTPVRTARRPRGPWVGALAVLALVAGTAYAAHVSRSQDGVISYPDVVAPSSWRNESYAGVEVAVPSTWGWGASPIRSADVSARGHLASCGADQAAVQSPDDHSSYITSVTGFVGRPAMVSMECVPWGSDGSLPRRDALWFDSPLPVGVKVVGATVAETRVVGSQHVTAFAPEAALRREILGTAKQVSVDANGCPTRAVARPARGPRGLAPQTLSVCVYSQDTGISTLLYSASWPRPSAAAYTASLASAPATRSSCPTPHGLWVALGLTGSEGSRWDVVNLGCDRIQLAGGGSTSLTPATVRPWALGGVPAYVALPPGGDPALQTYFRAPST